ncbi:hypothetical protein [Photobacterium aquimaris]|uniref:Polymerase nucleotidyl transferase domain-containing protein n=1 Tax=Photobacterium aquimaris TaxID=512643 RepID=A0A1Y6L306_9GAMM|nr:hypothetical protein [Photobacterium aquimaris]SMY17008.1 hypothetical protein PAQU9191_02249 [Photobacterium aquimaris]
MWEKVCQLIEDSSSFENLAVIAVIGSIGRGDKELNTPNLNDVDLLVIASGFNKDKKNILEKDLNKLLGTKYTDILVLSENKFLSYLKREFVSQSIYDLIRDFKIIKIISDSSYLNECSINPQKVELSSAMTVITTRGWALWSEENQSAIKKSSLSANYQLSKFISAIIDCSLILDGLYSGGCKDEKLMEFYKTKFYMGLKESERKKLNNSYVLDDFPLEEKFKFCLSLKNSIFRFIIKNYSNKKQLLISYFKLISISIIKLKFHPISNFIKLLKV